MKHFYCSCSRSKHDKHRLRAVSHFFTARSLRQTKISFVWIHKTFSSYNLNKHRDGHKEQNTGQPETRIMKEMYKSIPKPPIPPRTILGHLTRVKFRTVGNLTQNEARPVGHLTFVSKRLSAVGNKRISQFFDCRYHVGFSVVVVFISWNALNRARGVEKAKATRQRKKQEKKNDIMSV